MISINWIMCTQIYSSIPKSWPKNLGPSRLLTTYLFKPVHFIIFRCALCTTSLWTSVAWLRGMTWCDSHFLFVHFICPNLSLVCALRLSPPVPGTLGHRDTGTQGNWNTRTLGHQDTGTISKLAREKKNTQYLYIMIIFVGAWVGL